MGILKKNNTEHIKILHYILTLAKILFFLFLIIIQAPLLQHPSISRSVLWPSRENRIPANQSAALNTGHVSQLRAHRLGLILFSFAPTPRSSQHPRRNQAVTEAGVVPPVAYWTSLYGLPLVGWKARGGCCELPNLSCCSWAQAIKTWKPPLPCKRG